MKMPSYEYYYFPYKDKTVGRQIFVMRIHLPAKVVFILNQCPGVQNHTMWLIIDISDTERMLRDLKLCKQEVH